MFNETLRIERIARTQGGRYYCKAENGVGVPAIKSIRVDVQCECGPGCPGGGLGRRGVGEGGWRRDTLVEEGSRDPISPGPLFLRCVSPYTIHTCPSLTHRNLAQLSKVIREGGIVWIILYSFHR